MFSLVHAYVFEDEDHGMEGGAKEIQMERERKVTDQKFSSVKAYHMYSFWAVEEAMIFFSVVALFVDARSSCP